MHVAIAALIPSWWLNQRPSKKLLEHTAEKIRYKQERNAMARKSHVKRKRRLLRKLGIKLTEIPRCRWQAT